jgi:DNA (cytosine-5)-methyltransferase 1
MKSSKKLISSKSKKGSKKVMTSKQNTMIDLFAGTGAFSHAFEKNGFSCVFANDMIASSKEIYDLNHDHNPSVFCLKDLHEVPLESIPRHDLLCGGFPCQPFSIAGRQEGFEDSRSNVFWKIIEILKHHKPSTIILENVKNLQSHDKGNTFKVIMEELEKVGYFMKYKILDTSKLTGVPQHRERIYMVGFLDKSHYDAFDFDFPEKTNKQIVDYLDTNIGDKYYYTNKLKVFDEVNNNVTKHIKNNTLYQYRRYYVRENKSQCCPTLTANMGGGGHNVPLLRDDKGVRKLTPRECFSLQGFPKNYNLPKGLSDSALYKLAGNAVSVPIIERLAVKLSEIVQRPVEN